MAQKRAVLPPTNQPWVDAQGRPTQAFVTFMTALAQNNIGPFPSAANDAAAAKAGVPIGALYQNNGSVQIRIA